MRPIQPLEDFAILRVEAGFGCIDFEFDDGYCSSADEIDIEDIVLRGEYLLKVLKCSNESEMIRNVVKIA